MIGDRDLLIVLDNCEHVITAAAEVAEDLLRRCPGLRLLATSREGLRVGGETIWPVPPLAADDAVRALRRARRGRRRAARALRRRARRSSPTSAPASTGCRSPSSWPPPAPGRSRSRRSPLGSTIGSACSPAGRARRCPASRRCGPSSTGATSCSSTTSSASSSGSSVFPGGCDLATAEAVCADDDARRGRRRRPPPRPRRQVAGGRRAGGRRAALHPAADARPVRPGAARRTRRRRAHPRRDGRALRRSCARESAAAFTGDGQRAWLTAIDQEHDNLRAALDWAVANDDAETALMIAGGAALAALAGRHGGRRQALARRRVRLRGRGRRAHPGAGADRPRAPRLPRRRHRAQRRRPGEPRSRSSSATTTSRRWRWPTPSTPSRPPSAATSTRPAAAGRTCSTSTASRPRTRSRSRLASYSLAKLAILDGDLDAAERHYRAATEGFARLDRPVMSSMCLGMVADFDERAGDYPAAITDAGGGHRDQRVAARGLHRIAAGPPRLGAAPRRPAGAGRGGLPAGPRRRPAACSTPWCSSRPRPGWPSLHRLHGRDDAAVAAATEALELYRAGGFRRFRNRIDPDDRPPGRRRGVLRGARRDRRRAGRTGAGGDPARARRAACAPTPASRCRRSSRTTSRGPGGGVAALGPDAFARRLRARASTGRGRTRAVLSRDVSASAAPDQRAPGWCGVPAGRGAHSRRIP